MLPTVDRLKQLHAVRAGNTEEVLYASFDENVDDGIGRARRELIDARAALRNGMIAKSFLRRCDPGASHDVADPLEVLGEG